MIGMERSILKGLWQLVQSKRLRRALHESTVDTAIGAIIMFPLSVAIIKACIDYAGTSAEMAAFINFLGLTDHRKLQLLNWDLFFLEKFLLLHYFLVCLVF